jgi:P22 coat protein - gene protein 5
MPNVHVTSSLVLRDTLAALENDLVMANLVSTDYSSEFTKVGDTVNARKPIRFAGQSNNLDVSGYNEDLIEGTVPVRLQKTETIKFSIDPKDKVLRVEEFRKRYVMPAVDKLRDRIEQEIGKLYSDVFWFAGTPGTLPATFKSLGVPGNLLTYAGVSQSGRIAVHNPDTALELADGLKTVFVQDKVKTALEQQKIGRYAKFDNYESVHVPTHTVGNTVGAPVVNGAGQETTYLLSKDTYTSVLNTNGWTATVATLKKGDVFTIAGVFAINPITRDSTGNLQTFVVKADVTATAGGAMALTVSPAIIVGGAYATVNASPANGAVLTVRTGAANTSYKQSLLFVPEAFTLVTRPLEIAQGAGVTTENMMGNRVSLSVTKAVDFNTLKENCRLDMLFDVVTMNPHMAARLTA